MSKKTKKKIEQYEHSKEERSNIPHVGLVTPESDPETGEKKTYEYDPHLDPQLQWAGKKEHTSFEVPTVSLHVHERIDPKTIIETVKKEKDDGGQMSLFSEKKPLREAIDFYKHKEGWTNRLIAGDSLLVMNSLLEKEGMGGKVQMVYFDPPYGIKYGSNFQPFVNKRDVKDGNDSDLTAEPEMIKAFRDTSGRVTLWNINEDASYRTGDYEGNNHRRIAIVSYKEDKKDDFWTFQMRIKKAYEKIGHPYNRSVLNLMSGGSRQNVVMIRWIFKNFEDEENWRKNSIPKIKAAYNELFGAWDVDYNKYGESLADDWGFIRHHTFMPELSSPRN